MVLREHGGGIGSHLLASLILALTATACPPQDKGHLTVWMLRGSWLVVARLRPDSCLGLPPKGQQLKCLQENVRPWKLMPSFSKHI